MNKTPTSHHWAIDKDGDFTLQHRLTPVEHLEPGVYALHFAIPVGLFLTKKGDGFDLPSPMYGCEEDFIHRIVATYKHGKGFGVMLTGIKGTGKTVTCLKIANSVDQPCIIVPGNLPGLVGFLACIPQPVTLLFDEYEKNFKKDSEGNGDDVLLSFLDGSEKGLARRLCLFTSNTMAINENLIQRPGRIRYIKHFGNLPLDTIREVVVDRLVNPAKREPTIAFITSLETITLDIVTAICDEVNIHGDEPGTYASFFNVEQLVVSYDVYEHFRNEEFPKCMKFGAKVHPDWDNLDPGDTLRIGGKYFGNVLSKDKDENTVMVEYVAKDEKGEPIKRPPDYTGRDNTYLDSEYLSCIRKFELRPVVRKNYGQKHAWD